MKLVKDILIERLSQFSGSEEDCCEDRKIVEFCKWLLDLYPSNILINYEDAWKKFSVQNPTL
jgi:hypothetical protein